MARPRESGFIFDKLKVQIKNSLTLKYLHVVAKEDPRARTVDGRVVHDGSQL